VQSPVVCEAVGGTDFVTSSIPVSLEGAITLAETAAFLSQMESCQRR
jgi:hypothetical protein